MLQSEQTLENQFVDQLVSLGYEQVNVVDETSLLTNLKAQLETFNNITLSDDEFDKVMNHLTSTNAVFEKAKILRDRLDITRDSGETVYIKFLDEVHLDRNLFQVTQQVTMKGSHETRYDVTILVNGLPLVQVELKRRGLELKEAFNQVDRYHRHSYWGGSGLFRFVQIFIISNGVNTKYFANSHQESYKQTFFWAQEDNKTIRELPDFTNSFLIKDHIAKMLTQYIVLNETDKSLMILRPYQFYATEAIIDRVANPPESHANGYIWHTTGSGKTLTSFKASQLLRALPDVHKVVFCVDRKDLDYQTITEFNAFSKGSVDSTDNTSKLVEQFTDDTKLIVTTLQKLNTAISKPQHLSKMETLRDKKIIFIFDECHRSQFGDTHSRIVNFFNEHQMFGFTGTPIFTENAASKNGLKRTTKDLFHKKLHSYVITDAIKDENVLKFSIEYVGKYKQKSGSPNNVDIQVEGIDTKELVDSPERIEKITDYIIDHHKIKTKYPKFTAMLCVSSVDTLIQYYQLFQKKKEEGKHNLKVATIFSYTANEDDKDSDGILDEGGEIIGGDRGNKHTRDHLDSFISDYNGMFSTNYSTKDTKSFYGYYRDIAKKVKKRKVDILLVVNMFLTGFDSKTLNTLYVDKSLRFHGLIQAYSRTNRILNDLKSQGNIIAFRNLKKRTDEALTLFSNVDANEDVFIPPYEDYVKVFNETLIDLLELCPTAGDVKDLPDEEAELAFVRRFRELLRLMNILESYADFNTSDLNITPQDFANFKSAYLDLYDKVKSDTAKEKVSILEDVDFDLELIHRDTINVQYILQLLAELYDANVDEQKSIKKRILDTLVGEPELRTKKELIEEFIESTLPSIKDAALIPESFEEYWEIKRRKAFDDLVKEEELDPEGLKKVIERYVYTGEEPQSNPDISDIIERKLRLAERKPTRERVLHKVINYVSTFIKDIAA